MSGPAFRRSFAMLTITYAALLPACSGCDQLCTLLGLDTRACSFTGDGDSLDDHTTQVTIDVRFIGVEEDFFNRIGVDFDFNFDKDASLDPAGDDAERDTAQPQNAFLAPAAQLGGQDNTLSFFPFMRTNPTYLLPAVPEGDNSPPVNYFPRLPIIQDLPITGAFDQPDLNNLPGGATLSSFVDVEAASFGYAVLSDIEVGLFMAALEADTRNKVLAAPAATVFNNQSAVVISENEPALIDDVFQEFRDALAGVSSNVQQVISGPMLKVTPVISADRRMVRLDLIPIRALQTRLDVGAQANGANYSLLFPVVEPSRVQTSLTVTDGGTILLGGTRTTAGGSLQPGVPVLNKLPYIGRLFKNTAVIKDEQTLLIMITPRIIINESE